MQRCRHQRSAVRLKSLHLKQKSWDNWVQTQTGVCFDRHNIWSDGRTMNLSRTNTSTLNCYKNLWKMPNYNLSKYTFFLLKYSLDELRCLQSWFWMTCLNKHCFIVVAKDSSKRVLPLLLDPNCCQPIIILPLSHFCTDTPYKHVGFICMQHISFVILTRNE